MRRIVVAVASEDVVEIETLSVKVCAWNESYPGPTHRRCIIRTQSDRALTRGFKAFPQFVPDTLARRTLSLMAA